MIQVSTHPSSRVCHKKTQGVFVALSRYVTVIASQLYPLFVISKTQGLSPCLDTVRQLLSAISHFVCHTKNISFVTLSILQGWFHQIFVSMTLSCFALYLSLIHI